MSSSNLYPNVPCIGPAEYAYISSHSRIWLTGLQGTGKSYVSDELVSYMQRDFHSIMPLPAEVIHIGARCREKFGERNMATCENAATPKMSEKFVQDLVKEGYEKSQNRIILFESYPKNVEQVNRMEPPTCNDLILNIFSSEKIARWRVRDTRDVEGQFLWRQARMISLTEIPKALFVASERGFKIMTLTNDTDSVKISAGK